MTPAPTYACYLGLAVSACTCYLGLAALVCACCPGLTARIYTCYLAPVAHAVRGARSRVQQACRVSS